MANYSKINKLIDFFKFDEHRKVRSELVDIISSPSDKPLYDYGTGYFYQSFEKINLSGLRKTKERAKALNLDEFTKNKTILDIGTNSGFLPMEFENNFESLDGIDYNPTLIEVANHCKKYLQINNINFEASDFMSATIDKKYDLILSLANHTTFDGGIESFEAYFEKVLSILDGNGILVFESHHPQYESEESLEKVLTYLNSHFETIRSGQYNFNNFYDDGRKFYILKRK